MLMMRTIVQSCLVNSSVMFIEEMGCCLNILYFIFSQIKVRASQCLICLLVVDGYLVENRLGSLLVIV